MGIAQFLHAELRQRQWLPQDLANRADMQPASLAYILKRDQIIPKLETLNALAQALNLPLAALVRACGFDMPDDGLPNEDRTLLNSLRTRPPGVRLIVIIFIVLPDRAFQAIADFIRWQFSNLRYVNPALAHELDPVIKSMLPSREHNKDVLELVDKYPMFADWQDRAYHIPLMAESNNERKLREARQALWEARSEEHKARQALETVAQQYDENDDAYRQAERTWDESVEAVESAENARDYAEHIVDTFPDPFEEAQAEAEREAQHKKNVAIIRHAVFFEGCKQFLPRCRARLQYHTEEERKLRQRDDGSLPPQDMLPPEQRRAFQAASQEEQERMLREEEGRHRYEIYRYREICRVIEEGLSDDQPDMVLFPPIEAEESSADSPDDAR